MGRERETGSGTSNREIRSDDVSLGRPPAEEGLVGGSAVDALERCEQALGYRFRQRELLQTCLTHASSANHRLASNERLEFLGDSILGLIVCELLFQKFPGETEGELTRIKSIVVSRSTCSKISEALGLPGCMLLGKGLSLNETIPPSVSAAVFESLVAGVYLDGGFESARELVLRLIQPEVELAAGFDHGRNYKSLLQQHTQKHQGSTPVYRLLDEKGPDHSKCFKVSAQVGETLFPSAWGSNKKEAEQRAAQNALYQLEGRTPPHLEES
ncbi:MAG TPA: ribonuclease III [Planctomycetaceae bacterium]|jgi:ribonuclease-3|nr:ribonuclease III [Planctomycetaceae bacterium]